MIMFNDYIKLNKLAVFIISCLLGLYVVASVVFVGLIKMHTVNQLFYANRFTAQIPGMFLIGLVIIALLLAVTLFVTAVKQFLGKSRNLILMHRGRSYYLKMQLLLITISSVIVTSCYIILSAVGSTYSYALPSVQMPPLVVVTVGLDPLFIALLLFGFIALYYVVVYIIDIFANSKYRYQSMVARNLAVAGFMVRAVVILVSGSYLFLAANQFRVPYNSDYVDLLGNSINLMNYNIIILFFISLTVAIVVDYMCYFKKKVLV